MSTWYELTTDKLKMLPTHRLYTVYKLWQRECGLLACHSSYYVDDEDKKQYINAKTIRQFIKTILDERGHIERPEIKDKPMSKKALKRAAESRWIWETPKNEPKCLIENPEACIGKQVFKRSKKPFKSKNHYNTVKTITKNPHTNRKAFTFEEDNSIVDLHICNIRKEEK